jgi:hypothetical protein
VLLDRLDFLDRAEPVVGQLAQHRGHQVLRHRSPAGHPDRRHPVQPARVKLAGVVDQVGGWRAVIPGHLDEPDGVGRVRRADDDDQVGLARDDLDRGLAVLGRVADVVARRVEQRGEAFAQQADGLGGLVDRQGRLREPDHLGRVPDLDLRHALRTVDEADAGRGLPRGPDDLLVPLVTDQQDVVILGSKPACLVVHLGDQRAGRVDRAQAAALRVEADLRCDAVCGEHHDRAGRHLVDLRDKDSTSPLQRADDVRVVHDLPAHVHRRPELVQRHLDGLHGPVDPCAVAARLGEQDPSMG